jgi:hypothetical protein
MGLWAVLAACGGVSAEAPLTVPIGTTRDQLAGDLRRHEYCEGKERPAPRDTTETFPRCDTPGAEHSQSWVVAHFDGGGRAVKIQRWERHAEEARGLERFNELIEKRGTPSDEAKSLIAGQQELPEGTRTWVAFRVGERTLVGVYHLTPRPPGYATVLEEIIELTTPGE